MDKEFKIINDCRGMYSSQIIDTIIESRKIKDVDKFLNPTQDCLLPLESLKYIDKCRDIIVNGLKNGKKFKIDWDVDTDGIKAGTVMCKYLRHYTDKVDNYINKGKSHGLYGQDIENFIDTDILIIVDSLDEDISMYKQINDKGVEIIVLDHHDIKENIPYDDYVTLVSSNRDYDNKYLSGVGVVWKVCKYIDQYFGNNYADEYLDLVACGLIADMSDISEKSMENRYLVSQGLNNLVNPVIKKIIGSFAFNSTAIGFSIAPLINACNRVGKNDIAMKLFLEEDNKQINKYIKELKECKEEQKQILNELMEGVINQADKQKDNKVIYIFIDTDSDVAGLIGNKILEKYQRPILILKNKIYNNQEWYMGSARAVGVDNFNKLCKDTELCQAEGHDNAHGIKILVNNFNEFDKKLKQSLEDLEFKKPTVTIDVVLELSDITNDLIDKIKLLNKVSGKGFSTISVMIADINNYEIGNMSDYKHLVIRPNETFEIIKWNYQGSFEEMEESAMLNDVFHFIGTLDSGYIGRKFSLKLICNEIIKR